MKSLQIDRRRPGHDPAMPEDAGRPFEKLTLPLRDLVGVDIELLRQLGSVFSPLIAAKATFALKPGVWFRRVRFVI